jgi:hypothetical protein
LPDRRRSDGPATRDRDVPRLVRIDIHNVVVDVADDDIEGEEL